MSNAEEETFYSRPPLGLPTGSVRALLTLLILSVIVHELVKGRELAVVWSETFVIALAHYFTSRRFVNLPADLRKRLEKEGVIPQESNPLFLPRHSIRLLIVGVIAGLGYYLYREHRLWEPQSMAVLSTVCAYLLGALVNTVTGWWSGGRKSRMTYLWEDLKAVTVLFVLSATACLYFLIDPSQIPHQLQVAAVCVALFYFGSR